MLQLGTHKKESETMQSKLEKVFTIPSLAQPDDSKLDNVQTNKRRSDAMVV